MGWRRSATTPPCVPPPHLSRTEIRQYAWMDGRAVAVIEGGQIFFIRTDHIGRPVFATNDLGAKVWAASYLSFGGVHVATGGIILRFPGPAPRPPKAGGVPGHCGSPVAAADERQRRWHDASLLFGAAAEGLQADPASRMRSPQVECMAANVDMAAGRSRKRRGNRAEGRASPMGAGPAAPGVALPVTDMHLPLGPGQPTVAAYRCYAPSTPAKGQAARLPAAGGGDTDLTRDHSAAAQTA